MSIVSRIQNIILRKRIEPHSKPSSQKIIEGYMNYEKDSFLRGDSENEQ